MALLTKAGTTYAYTPDSTRRVEVGDAKQSSFYPQVKISDANNESNFSIRVVLPTTGATITEIDDKIVWSRGDYKATWYDKPDASPDGGFEFEVILGRKPPTNKVQFTVASKNVRFDRMPALTQEMIDAGLSCPANIPGSYAVYSTVGEQKKLAQIYRPHAVDAKGNGAWCDMVVDDSAYVLTITVPQTFLDSAAYPVTVDPTFGYTSAGSYWMWCPGPAAYGIAKIDVTAGNLSSVTVYANDAVQVGVYTDSSGVPGSLISSGTSGGGSGWKTVGLSGSIATGTYWVVVWHATGVSLLADPTGGSHGYYKDNGYWAQFGLPSNFAVGVTYNDLYHWTAYITTAASTVTRTYTGTGGATSGGTATKSRLSVRSYSGSGGAQSGGSATLARTVVSVKAYSGSGGAQSAGSATCGKSSIRSFTGTGGAQSGGSASVSKLVVKTVTSTGGAQSGGTATCSHLHVKAVVGTGGAVSGGSATRANVKAYSGSGLIQSGGTAAKARTKAFVGSGGGQSAGSALPAKVKAYNGTGLAQSGGTANRSRTKSYVSTGGAFSGGHAASTFTAVQPVPTYGGSGGAISGGSATCSHLHIKSYTGTGGALSSGSASLSRVVVRSYVGSGGGTSSGSASVSRSRIRTYTSTGGAQSGGSSSTSKLSVVIRTYAASGGANTGGSAASYRLTLRFFLTSGSGGAQSGGTAYYRLKSVGVDPGTGGTGAVNNAVSEGILPKSLCLSLVEIREVPILANVYRDGTSQRKTLANTSRKRFRLGKRLTSAQLAELRAFFLDMTGKAFTVYPLASQHDPSGQSTAGRYLCRFEGGWSESIGMGRHEAQIELVEVA